MRLLYKYLIKPVAVAGLNDCGSSLNGNCVDVRCRYHAALTRYLSAEEERKSPGEARGVSARSVPSASSHKQVWDGLEDIGTIRTRETKDIKVKGIIILTLNTNNISYSAGKEEGGESAEYGRGSH